MGNIDLFGGGTRLGTEIWAVGGGKGGTGKSFLTSSMGLCLASMGRRVVLIDADLGGANLHSFLGIRQPSNSLTDFFEHNVPLKDLVVETGIDRVRLVTGDLNSLASDSIKYTQKLKLFRHIKGLDADFVLIDLGSGSHNNTIDTFLFADRMVVVLVPEITAIENMYHFIKNVYFRRLKRFLSDCGVKDLVEDVWRNRGKYGIKTLLDLVQYLRDLRPDLAEALQREAEGFKLFIVLNQVRSSAEVRIGASVRSVLKKFLGFEGNYVGYVEYDDSVWRCTNTGRPFMLACPASHCAKEIHRLTGNLVDGAQVHVVRA